MTARPHVATAAPAAPQGTSMPDVRWIALHETLQPGLLRWLQARMRDRDDAEDCCQEAFVRLLQELRAGREPDNAAAWLRRVAQNLVISRARHAQVVARTAGGMLPIPAADPVLTAVVARERYIDTAGALGRLSADDQRLIMLAASGATTERLAAALGIRPGAARTRLHRARRSLQNATDG